MIDLLEKIIIEEYPAEDSLPRMGTPEKRKTNKQTWPLRPPDELRQWVEAAMKATGKKRQTLILECVRKALPSVVARLQKEQQEAAKSFGESAPKKKDKK